MTETQLKRVIRKAESGELDYGGITIRISRFGFSITRFCKVNKFKQTMKEITEAFITAKKLKMLSKNDNKT